MTEGAGAVPRARDLELLRRYEPILAYTRDERFFPVDAEDYIRCCSLWEGEQRLADAGELTAERLVATAAERTGTALSLLFVQRPFDRREVRAHRARAKPPIARSGRLAAVGLIGRVFDVLLRASLFMRGSVPGGVAAAAADLGERHLSRDRATYYGRVVREGGYVILQYWFLYAMNDWRTTFGGVNDHEADWEAVTVYLAGEDMRPSWVACSSHEDNGDDLRRRWDDPDLHRLGDHPVVYVGAGSHSGAILKGQYVVTVNPMRLRAYLRGARRVTGFVFPWTRQGRRYGVGIPFLDYALGNGKKIGPVEGEHRWRPELISDDTPWVRG
ncbi:MAG: hypothetical protein ACJ72W_16345, partial [Actinoallomurus sp.]